MLEVSKTINNDTYPPILHHANANLTKNENFLSLLASLPPMEASKMASASGIVPLSMEQYKYFFQTVRLPGLVIYKPLLFILIIYINTYNYINIIIINLNNNISILNINNNFRTEKDNILHYEHSNHVVILRKGHVYKIDVILSNG